MKIKDIFDQYSKCKLCKLNNVIMFRKHKEPYSGGKKQDKKNHFTKDIIEHIDNEILILEEGAHHTKISEMIIYIDTDTCKGSEVPKYEYLPFFLSIKICCSKQISREFDYDDEETFGSSIRKSILSEYETKNNYDNSHYIATFEIQIDQKTKEIITTDIISEDCETNDFLYERDYTNNKTRIIRKQKVISLPWILNKELDQLDFNSILNNTSLLK